MRYLNSDGSVAALCGNATLCTAKLVVELGISPGGEFEIETDLDVVRARYDGEMPEIDLQAAEQVQECYAATLAEGERRIGFALVGVPHLVVLCDDVDRAEVVARGRRLRHDAGLRQGANVNFVSPGKEGGWRVRTYERGVEAETLACGTGAVAAALLLTRWGEVRGPVSLQTRSGRDLGVRFEEPGGGGKASLAGEARIVFAGVLSELPWQTGSRP
jgi:diaminopimelate epimerase